MDNGTSGPVFPSSGLNLQHLHSKGCSPGFTIQLNQPRPCDSPEAFTPRVIRVRLEGTRMLEGVMEALDRTGPGEKPPGGKDDIPAMVLLGGQHRCYVWIGLKWGLVFRQQFTAFPTFFSV